ncbi:MAG: DNA-3-methyladenine glycosylase 2 family protein [Yoonia sp.]|nr:DNA-3-methyladenine glycosylase 2 family protein [Yoonia sp.]
MTDRIIVGPACLEEGSDWLAGIEPRFAAILPHVSPLPLRLKPDGFGPLLHIILGQQVSVASANALWSKLQAADMTTPVAVKSATQGDLRGLGLSQQKARYAHALADADIDFDGLHNVPSDRVIKTLCAVKGIGMWTAEVYTMFSLGRADVFAPGDLAIQEAAKLLFDLPERPTERTLRKMADVWSPWRSVAARLFWAYYASTKQKDGII